jgi:hypothetical protein
MNPRFTTSLGAVLVAVLCTHSVAFAQATQVSTDSDEKYSIKEEVSATGSRIKQAIVEGGDLPYDKKYEELSPKQKAILRSYYSSDLSERDVPPFPLHGLQALYGKVAVAHQRIGEFAPAGELDMDVQIDAAGIAQSVEVRKVFPDKEFLNYVAGVVMAAQYKPATCDGKPCAMAFPFRMTVGMAGKRREGPGLVR